MAIARVVRATERDTFCSLGFDNGFRNCAKIREANPDIANRQLQAGDNVNIPEVTQKQEPGATEQRHRFKRLGEKQQVFIVQDFNRATPEGALGDRQRQVCISNYVPTRQGTGFTNADWRDHTFFGHDAGASADPDHFKVQVHDRFAKERGETEVKITLQTQQPVLNDRLEIERWQDIADVGTVLTDVVCRQVAPDSEWYRSHYLRLVIDAQDHAAKRPHGRISPTLDTGVDVSKQTVVAPTVTDKRIEILDMRMLAFKEAADCAAATPDARCRARAIADIGKDEKALKIKVFRIGGAAGSGISDAQVDTMIFTNYRLTLAQSNVGVKLVDDRVHDVPIPNNMITVSDFNGVKSDGGGTMRVVVSMPAGNVTATITTERKKTPEETANRLAAALRAQGVTCRVSPNPPVQSSSNDFGSCDILCFRPDGSPARIISATSTDSDQTLQHTGGFNNASVRDPGDQYGAANNTDAQMVGSMDYRAVCKNYNTGTDHLAVMLVNGFTRASLLGKALLPYRDVVARLRPRRDFSMCVFLDQGGAVARTVLTHEAGHVLLDAFHTTSTDANETDLFGNTYDNNANLSYSEWMAAFNREPSFIHKRMSDDPLTVRFNVVRTGVNNLQATGQTLGGANPSPVRRFRTLSAFVLENLRPLRPAPGADL